MKILVLNCGSSSVKFRLFQADKQESLVSGIVEKIGSDDAILRYKPEAKAGIKKIQKVSNHDEAIKLVFDSLLHSDHGVIKSKDEIIGIGHRVVHGGEKFTDSVLITSDVIQGIKDFIRFAPLHNPHNLRGIEVCKKLMPKVPQVAVFDTAFHSKMPPEAYIYALPYELYQKSGIRRFGFHGTSHQYVSHKAAEFLKKPYGECKIITCHLGNGASMAAVYNGRSIDTSMGFTPLEGLVMGTRCGDIDPALVLYIAEYEKLTNLEMDSLMNKKSGLKGLSGSSNDMRDIIEQAQKGSHRHRLAVDVFCRRVKKYIGAYAALMGGIDMIVFTAGIGENSPLVREKCVSGLEFLEIEIDNELNKENAICISKGETKVLVIPTNEELVIASETKRIVEKTKLYEEEKLPSSLEDQP